MLCRRNGIRILARTSQRWFRYGFLIHLQSRTVKHIKHRSTSFRAHTTPWSNSGFPPNLPPVLAHSGAAHRQGAVSKACLTCVCYVRFLVMGSFKGLIVEGSSFGAGLTEARFGAHGGYTGGRAFSLIVSPQLNDKYRWAKSSLKCIARLIPIATAFTVTLFLMS